MFDVLLGTFLMLFSGVFKQLQSTVTIVVVRLEACYCWQQHQAPTNHYYYYTWLLFYFTKRSILHMQKRKQNRANLGVEFVIGENGDCNCERSWHRCQERAVCMRRPSQGIGVAWARRTGPGHGEQGRGRQRRDSPSGIWNADLLIATKALHFADPTSRRNQPLAVRVEECKSDMYHSCLIRWWEVGKSAVTQFIAEQNSYCRDITVIASSYCSYYICMTFAYQKWRESIPLSPFAICSIQFMQRMRLKTVWDSGSLYLNRNLKLIELDAVAGNGKPASCSRRGRSVHERTSGPRRQLST